MGGMLNWGLGCRRIVITMLESQPGHALAQAALFEEIFLQSQELLVNQVVGLVDKAQRDVRHDFGGAGFTELAICLVSLRALAAKLADASHLINTRSGVLSRKTRNVEEKSNRMKDGERPIFVPATSLIVGHSPLQGCSLLPPRGRHKSLAAPSAAIYEMTCSASLESFSQILRSRARR
jgi:hypothetical protein